MSIKVGVRVRPFNLKEQYNKSKLCVDMVGNKTYLFSEEQPEKSKQFIFDYSFWSHDQFNVQENGQFLASTDKHADQKHVFKQLGEQMVMNAWKGQNCCLMAYGQKRSGKSYTMFGDASNKGIVPLFNERIFELIASNKESKECQVQISMLEVYNQKIRDLIPAQPTNEYLKIKQTEALGVYVQGLSKHQAHNFEEAHKLISEGFTNRLVQATKMGQQTIRSNVFINVELKQTFKPHYLQTKQGQQMFKQKVSIIQFVLLEHSNKVGKTGVQTYKEISNICKGLTNLGLVISALRDQAAGKKRIIPYRNSNITRLLKNSLEGNCHTYLLCCIAPSFDNYFETLSTLRFGDRARGISNNPVIIDKGVEQYEKIEKKQKQYFELPTKKQQQLS